MKHRPVCCRCETEFVLKESVVRIIDMGDAATLSGGQSVWLGDKYVCPKCEATIVVNFAERSIGRAGLGAFPTVQKMQEQYCGLVLNYPLEKLTRE